MNTKESRSIKSSLSFKISKQDTINGIFLVGSFFAARVLVFDVANPFAVAYISNFLFKGNKFYIAAMLSSLGIISNFRTEFSIKYLLAIVLMAMLNLVLTLKSKNVILQSAVAAVSVAIAGLALTIIRGQGIYYIAINLLESILIFTLGIVLIKGISCIYGQEKRGSLSHEEVIGVVAVIAVVSLGLADINIFGIGLRYIFSSLIVLLAAQSAGAGVGAVAGLIMGFLLNIVGLEFIYFAVLLGFSGFAAGILKDKHKLLSFAAFFATAALFALYFDTALLNFSTLLSLGLAGTIYYFMPKALLINIPFVLNPAIIHSEEYIEKVRYLVMERIESFSHGYSRLSQIFNDIVPKQNGQDPIELTSHNKDTANEYEIINNNWQQKLKEARITIAEQFMGVSKVMQNLSKELKASLHFESRYENAIIDELAKQNMEVENVIVLKNIHGKYEITLSQKPTKFNKRQVKKIGEVLSKTIKKDMEFSEDYFSYNWGVKRVSLEYFERKPFYIYTGMAGIAKSKGAESGDSFSQVQLRDGMCIMALSDGMGSGKRAKGESATAIELLEELLEGGFEKDIAVKLINTALLLRSDTELFSTLDICLLNLFTGIAEFVKIGASYTFLCRDAAVEAIGSWTLPVGILDTVEMDTQKRQLNHGDIIVMMTDGVVDSAKNAEAWVINLLKNINLRNPQDIAEHILNEAKENYGYKIKDDMTILVARVYER